MTVGPWSWSTTAASNGNADSNINYQEGSGFKMPQINDSARALMASLRGFANTIGGAKTSGGSANAQTFTSDSVAAITAYAAGQKFTFKAGYTNSGACTFNVDGVGAKSIKKGGAQSALAANDIVANGIYTVHYEASGDVFLLQNPEGGQTAAGNQPLDATLTALAALSWSSGNALVQFTAADTVSLTLAPSVSSVTASQGAANTTPTADFVNTTDNASVLALRIEGDRATPANNDNVYMDARLSSAAGVQTSVGRLKWLNTNVTAGAEAAFLYMGLLRTGTMTDYAILTYQDFRPGSNDLLSLGVASVGWSDLFLASGGVINWNNGTFTLTQASSVLTASGSVRADIALSSETSGTLTSASRDTYIAAAGGITLPNSVFGAGQWQLVLAGASARTITRGSGIAMYVNGVDSSSATLSAQGVMLAFWSGASTVYLSGDVV